MGKYLIILLLCFPALSYGQGFAALGNGNPNDTARILNNYFLPMKAIRTPAYAPGANDSNIIMTISSGKWYGYSLSSFLSRIGSYIGTPNIDQVLAQGGSLSADRDIDLQDHILKFKSGILHFQGDSAAFQSTVSSQKKMLYLVEYDTFSGTEIPDANWVKNQLSQSSFDYDVTSTITFLTDARFVRPVRYIICDCGITYNKTWFSQAGTTITFLNNLKFYNGYKITPVF